MDSSTEAARMQRGFTLLELMIAVAVIAILALVVVPTFFKQSRKTKSASEVSPMLAELAIREEQFKVENGRYLELSACPMTPKVEGSPASDCADEWAALRVNPPGQTLYCSYEVVTGGASASASTGPSAAVVATATLDGFAFNPPATSWYYITATCDMDGDAAKNAKYFMSSVDATIQKRDEGF